MSTVRKSVCRSVIAEMAWVDGSSPPGKMYFWIQVWVLRLASIRVCGIVIAWIATRPPGRTSRSSVAKYRRPRVVSDRLDHLHRHHRVVTPFDVAVVAQVDRHRVGQPRRGNPKPRQLLLLDRQGHRADVRSAGGRADAQLAPPGADLENPAALADSGDVEQPIDLAPLRRSQIRR